MRKELGKIQSVNFGYDEYVFSLSLTLGGEGWGVQTGIQYNPTYKNDPKQILSITMVTEIQKLLKDAKVSTVDKLLNKPVEVMFDNNTIVSFRILTEVL